MICSIRSINRGATEEESIDIACGHSAEISTARAGGVASAASIGHTHDVPAESMDYTVAVASLVQN